MRQQGERGERPSSPFVVQSGNRCEQRWRRWEVELRRWRDGQCWWARLRPYWCSVLVAVGVYAQCYSPCGGAKDDEPRSRLLSARLTGTG